MVLLVGRGRKRENAGEIGRGEERHEGEGSGGRGRKGEGKARLLTLNSVRPKNFGLQAAAPMAVAQLKW